MKPIVCGLLLCLSVSSCARKVLSSPEDLAKKVEEGLCTAIVIKGQPLSAFTMEERMKRYQVPGVSLAFFNQDGIQWTRSYGVMDTRSTAPITPSTMFQVGSVSKPVTAIAALSLVKEGKIKLEEDVNTYLKAWKVPDNAFTQERPVTLNGLLSHSAGVTVHGFFGYAPTDTIPALKQVLDGDRPAKNRTVTVDTLPGSHWRYSGGGYAIVEQLLTDVAGQPFDELCQERIFDQLGMQNSTFRQNLPAQLQPLAASGHSNGNPIKHKWFRQTSVAAAGLWSTPSDLAKLGVELLQSMQGKSAKLLDPQLTNIMTSAQYKDWGLGFMISGTSFQHMGSCEGFRSAIFVDKQKKQGVVLMINDEAGVFLGPEIMFSLAKVYQWAGFEPQVKEMATLKPALLDSLAGAYQFTNGWKIVFTKQGHYLDAHLNGEFLAAFYPQSETEFFTLEGKRTCAFNQDTKTVSMLGFTPNPVVAHKVK